MTASLLSSFERRTSNPDRWLDGLCREFSAASGWNLHYVSERRTEPTDRAIQSLEWCWHRDITDGGRRFGTICLELPGTQQPELAFETAWRLADLLAGQACRVLQSQRIAENQATEIAMLIARTDEAEQDVRQRLRSLLRASAHLLNFRDAGLFVLGADGRSLRLRLTHHIAEKDVPAQERSLSMAAHDLLALNGKSVIVTRDSDSAALFLPEQSATAVCVGVGNDAGPVGTLWLFDRRSRTLDDTELQLLRGFARQIADVFERIVLLRDSEVRQRMSRELDVVAKTTVGCSEVRDAFPGFEAAVRCLSHSEIGGDLCEVFAFDEHRTFAVLGDGSGCGIPAAMVMTATRGALHALIEAAGSEAPTTEYLMSAMNRSLLRIAGSQHFLSAILGMFDGRDHSFVFSNAGHPPGLHVRGDRIHTLDPQGMLLGVVDVATYASSRIETQSGDLLIFFSDGITEARSRTQQMFRHHGVLDAIRGHTFATAGDVLDTIWKSYETHTGGENADDRTLMVMRVR